MLTKTGESSTGSRRTWAFAPLCPRVCRSGRDFGVVVERSVLLNPLALCLVVNGGREAGGCPRRPASSADNRQGSASGKRMAGYPGPPWRFPPVSYPRAGGLSTAQGSPCAGRRLPGLCQHTFRTAPVLKPTCAKAQVRRQAIFSLGPSTARSLFVKNKKRMGGGLPD